MKILIHSNAPHAGTGYGQQTALTALAFKKLGHDVAISAFWGIHGAITRWHGLKVYPGGLDGFGNDVVLGHAADHFGGSLADGLVLALVDAFVLQPDVFKQVPTAVWVPVDHSPTPAPVLEFFERSGATPIAMSRFGQRQLADEGLAPLYVPHAVDTTLFQEIDQAEARSKVGGLPDSAFVVGMVAANKGFPARKGFPEAISAFARFAANHDDAMLYLHTHPHQAMGGVSLPALIAAHGIPVDRVLFAEPYILQTGIGTDFMPNVYSALDVLMNPAYGEGFGVPIMEAQACGTPVVVTDCTAMRELAGPGWLVDGQELWTEQNSFRKVPAIDGLHAALEQAYENAGRRRPWARDFALDYDIDRVVANHWIPVLAELERRFAPVTIGEPAQIAGRRPLVVTGLRAPS